MTVATEHQMQRSIFILAVLLSSVAFDACRTSSTPQRSTNRQLRFRDSAQYAAREQRDAFTRASVRFNVRDYAGALRLLSPLNDPDELVAISFLRSKCYQAMGRADSALIHINAACTSDSSREELWLLRAELLIPKRRFEEAAMCYIIADSLHPSASNKFLLAKCYEQIDPPRAISLLEEVYEQTADVTALFELSNLYERSNQTKEYLKTMERIMEAFPAKALPFQNFFESLVLAHDFNRALELLEHDTYNYDVSTKRENLIRLGVAVFEDSAFCEKQTLERYSALADTLLATNEDVLELCGMLWARCSREDVARRYLVRVTVLDSSGVSALRIAGYLYQQQRAQLAIQVLTADPGLLSRSSRVNFLCGVLYSLRDSNSIALRYLQAGNELDKADADITFQMAFVQQKLGHTHESDRWYEETLRLNPENATALNNLAYSYSERDTNLVAARSYVEKALRLDSLNPSFLDTYGWILHKLNDYRSAERYLLRATERNNSSATLFEHVGDNYAKLGDRERAVEAWKRAFELDNSKTYLRERLLNSK